MEAVDAAQVLANSAMSAAKGFDEMKTTAGLSGAIVTEMGRTISDAPYGLKRYGEQHLAIEPPCIGMFAT